MYVLWALSVRGLPHRVDEADGRSSCELSIQSLDREADTATKACHVRHHDDGNGDGDE